MIIIKMVKCRTEERMLVIKRTFVQEPTWKLKMLEELSILLDVCTHYCY